MTAAAAPTEAYLDLAHKKVCDEYANYRAAGGSASSPYAYFLMVQASNRRAIGRSKGGAGFDLWELLVVRDDGTQAVVDLRHLAPYVFGEPR